MIFRVYVYLPVGCTWPDACLALTDLRYENPVNIPSETSATCGRQSWSWFMQKSYQVHCHIFDHKNSACEDLSWHSQGGYIMVHCDSYPFYELAMSIIEILAAWPMTPALHLCPNWGSCGHQSIWVFTYICAHLKAVRGYPRENDRRCQKPMKTPWFRLENDLETVSFPWVFHSRCQFTGG